MTGPLTEEQTEVFDKLVASEDSPMAIVTTASGGRRAGCLVGFHSQCSIEPRRYAIWLSKANHTYRVALEAEILVWHLLREDDGDLAELFGGETGDDVDKFEDVEVEEGPDGVPLLRRCPDRLVLRRTSLLDEGSDHVLMVTEPIDVHGLGEGRPLRLHEVTHIVPGHEAEERSE